MHLYLPRWLSILIATENCVFDLTLVIFTAVSLCQGLFDSEDSRNVIWSIYVTNVFVVFSYVLLIWSALSNRDEKDSLMLLVVLFNLVHVTSIWLADLLMMGFQKMRCCVAAPRIQRLYIGERDAQPTAAAGVSPGSHHTGIFTFTFTSRLLTGSSPVGSPTALLSPSNAAYTTRPSFTVRAITSRSQS